MIFVCSLWLWWIMVFFLFYLLMVSCGSDLLLCWLLFLMRMCWLY